MPATGARPKAAKINLMDCTCLCSEVEISLSELGHDGGTICETAVSRANFQT